jgi:pyrroline-5-carboxylate reductase
MTGDIKMNIGVIGAGNMAEAIMKGLIQAGLVSPEHIICSDISESRRAYIQKNLGVKTTAENREVIMNSEVVFLAIKPNVVSNVLDENNQYFSNDKMIISIAAGITLDFIQSHLASQVAVIRVMPNTPALVLEGASALAGGKYATEENLKTALRLLESVGKAIILDEKLLDAVTGLSGSGPAYVLEFIDALASGGVLKGLNKQTALLLAAQTVLGTAKLYLETQEHPAILRDRVTSPGGTTIAGLAALEKGGFRNACIEAVAKAADRSHELSGK